MKYAIDVWIYVPPEDQDDPLTYDSFNEAMDEVQQLKLMQPENIYKLRVVGQDEFGEERDYD